MCPLCLAGLDLEPTVYPHDCPNSADSDPLTYKIIANNIPNVSRAVIFNPWQLGVLSLHCELFGLILRHLFSMHIFVGNLRRGMGAGWGKDGRDNNILFETGIETASWQAPGRRSTSCVPQGPWDWKSLGSEICS